MLVYELSGSGFESGYSHLSFNFALASRKEFLDIQATMECGFTLKCVGDMTRIYSQMHRTDKYSERSSFIWTVWPNNWAFVYELSGSVFDYGFQPALDCRKRNNGWGCVEKVVGAKL